MIKSPLRYPGGKSRAIRDIEKYFPETFSEYREPFVGGGSLFIYIKQKFPQVKIWINDLNPELFLFWKVAQSDLNNLVKELYLIKANSQDGRVLFEQLSKVNTEGLTELERAVRFFILNRITFSGTIESGGFSLESFRKRFTNSSIERLEKLETILDDINITNLDYNEVNKVAGKEVFIFLDPPYFSATASKLYGKRGNLHTFFDHERFALSMQECPHKFLITYDDSPVIINNFKSFNTYQWELQYGMNNYKKKTAAKGRELIITNYDRIPDYQQLNLNFL